MQETFLAWQRPALSALATDVATGTHVEGELTLNISAIGNPVVAKPRFRFVGPADVVGLAPGAVIGRKPAPGTLDAEISRVAHVELRDADLPWRYSPVRNPLGGGLRPWLVLVVGITGVEVVARGDEVDLRGEAITSHPLASAHLWAHAHQLPGGAISRILSPRDLTEGQSWTAVLVPTWVARPGGDGALQLFDAWTASDAVAGVTVPCLDAWTFRTIDEDDDFRAIASRLEPLTVQEEADLTAASFGRAQVDPGPAATDPTVDESLATFGALVAIAPEGAPPFVEDPLPDAIAAKTAELVGSQVTPGEPHRWILGPPRYDEPWLAEKPDGAAPPAPPGPGWRQQLLEDLRARGAAGIGAWAAISWQQRIVDGAAAQAGSLAAAAQRVRHLGIGLRATRTQWSQRIPTDPVAALSVLGPMLARLPTGSASTALDDLSDRTPWLVPALFSSAARRMLRPRSALTRVASESALSPAGLIDTAARTCPEVPKGEDAELVDLLAGGRDLDGGAAMQLLSQLAESEQEGSGPALVARSLLRQLDGVDGPIIDGLRGGGLYGTEPWWPPCRPVDDVGALAVSIVGAIDPTVDRPFVIDFVLGEIEGLREPVLSEPDVAPELDIPLWSFVAKETPNWLLPGAGDIPLDRVLAVSTNPPFIEALLVGANHQAVGELRWRNLPVTTGWMPLRRFWQSITDVAVSADHGVACDVKPILDIAAPIPAAAPLWPDQTALGDVSHADNVEGAMLVVVLHTELFRRYPKTQVYLAPNANGENWEGAVPPDVDSLGGRVWPVFSGVFHPELVFFGFPRPPDVARSHWLVLEEPPPGIRFVHPTRRPTAAGALDAAQYAGRTLERPIRAFFGNLL